MPTECAESGCPNQTDSGICQQCAAEQKYGTTSRAYDPDGSRVELREGETRDDDSHAGVVAAQLAEADDEDLEELEDEKEVRTDGGEDESVIYRPKGCGDQSFSAYNVATWGKLSGQEVRHEKYGTGVVERSNDMSREAWVRFDHLRIVKLGNLEVLAEDGGVRSLSADSSTEATQ